ncbi:hypothetical protein D9M72_623750 [compost metagenome]
MQQRQWRLEGEVQPVLGLMLFEPVVRVQPLAPQRALGGDANTGGTQVAQHVAMGKTVTVGVHAQAHHHRLLAGKQVAAHRGCLADRQQKPFDVATAFGQLEAQALRVGIEKRPGEGQAAENVLDLQL